MDCLEKAIDGDDVKAALEIVKGMGILAPATPGSDDADALATEARVKAAESEPAIRTRGRIADLLANI